MSIFSKVKNAKKAAEEHKRASSQAQAEIKPPTRYKHIPTHAAQDALSCAPTSWSVEESRAKISAAHRRKSDLSRKSNFLRTSSEPAMASREYIHRTESDLSIDSVITKQRHSSYQSPSPYTYSGYIPPRNRPYFTHASSSSSMVMKRSPLSNTSTKEEEGGNAESSKNSTYSSTSSQALEMKPTVSRETKTEFSEFNSKNPIVEITSPDGNKESALFTEKAKGHYSSSGPSLLPAQTLAITPPPTVSRKTSKRSWFRRRNILSVR